MADLNEETFWEAVEAIEAEFMETGYTLKQIESAWTDYKTKKVMRILKDGKWHLKPTGASLEGATKASLVEFNKVVSFPTYLRVHHQ